MDNLKKTADADIIFSIENHNKILTQIDQGVLGSRPAIKAILNAEIHEMRTEIYYRKSKEANNDG